MAHRLLLTFDVEDFINRQSFKALHYILSTLKKYNIRGLFFLTGHMAEKLVAFPGIVRSLALHEIGFHSSSHSVHPTIFEYCDVENYEDAYLTSLKRETSHIDPISGRIEGKGGIHALKILFPTKNILAYRAPGFCCPPPHLEAMSALGMKFDFSWNLSKATVSYKEMTFYPRPVFLDCEKAFLDGKNEFINWVKFLRSTVSRKVTILNFHPSLLVKKDYWDSIYHDGNPQKLYQASSRDSVQVRAMLLRLERLLKTMHYLDEFGLLDVSPDLHSAETELKVEEIDVNKVLDDLVFWPRTFFAYEPKHFRPQLCKFLGLGN